MTEFNEDGSIKLPYEIAQKKKQDTDKLRNQRCIAVKREVVSEKSPKKCVLHVRLSGLLDEAFLVRLYSYFKENAEVPTKLVKVNDKEFDVEIGTCFRRCSDCNSLVGRFRESLDGNVIEDKGSCTFQGRSLEFCYEDYFD
ncbi:MAG: hypothetical protein KJ601_06215 [Nanoarchaeota archaeon]|nr:hypothetical protein [Nanoarchaeota archaeon]